MAYFRKVAVKEGMYEMQDDACHLMGVMVYNGIGCEQNADSAIFWLKRGADRFESAECASFLANIYESEEHKDMPQAVKYYRMANEYGDTTALVNLGRLYANNGNNGNYSGNNGRPANGGNYGGNSGYNNGRPVNGGSNHNTPPPPPPAHNSGNYGGYSGGGYIPGYADMYPGKRPPMPTVRTYTKVQVYDRTNAAEIVVNTLFSSKMEAYYYIARLLDERYYTVSSYGNNYNWLRSDVSFIPTPFDWADPMTHNQFQMYFKIYKSCGRIRVAITAQWRESVLSDRFLTLRFQPSNTYSTYYAWNVLEDIADNIPNTGIYFRTADIL